MTENNANKLHHFNGFVILDTLATDAAEVFVLWDQKSPLLGT